MAAPLDWTPDKYTNAEAALNQARTEETKADNAHSDALVASATAPNDPQLQANVQDAEQKAEAAEKAVQKATQQRDTERQTAQDEMCANILRRLWDNEGTWTFYKNILINAAVANDYIPIMFLKKDIVYLGTNYAAIAHIHGQKATFPTGAVDPAWGGFVYDATKPDKVEVFLAAMPAGTVAGAKGLVNGHQYTYNPAGKGAKGYRTNPVTHYPSSGAAIQLHHGSVCEKGIFTHNRIYNGLGATIPPGIRNMYPAAHWNTAGSMGGKGLIAKAADYPARKNYENIYKHDFAQEDVQPMISVHGPMSGYSGMHQYDHEMMDQNAVDMMYPMMNVFPLLLALFMIFACFVLVCVVSGIMGFVVGKVMTVRGTGKRNFHDADERQSIFV